MRGIGALEFSIIVGAAIFAFLVSISNRPNKTRGAAVTSIVAALFLLAWDRYLYIQTSRGLIDSLTCWVVPLAVPCRTAVTSPKPSDELLARAEGANSISPAPAPVVDAHTEQEPERSQIIQLSNNNARSVWTTSVYSFAPGGGGPGGGLADDQLKVGGWGDIYVSLISFDVIETRRPVRKATLILSLAPSPSGSTRTPMRLLRVIDNWGWGEGDRLWWRNRPRGVLHSTIPPPAAGSDRYSIDVTELYNNWANLRYPALGLMLEPIYTDNNFNVFYSTRAAVAKRPVLQLMY